MKQVIIRKTGGPEVLETIETAQPRPLAGQVVVRAEAIGVGRPDILIRNGTYKWMPPLPVSPGSELAGPVVALGPDVESGLLGRTCLVSAREFQSRGGCYTEFIAVGADDLFVLPDGVSAAKAACLGNYQVALAILSDATGGREIRSILIYGAAGGVGSALAQIASRRGVTVIGLVSTDEKAHFAAKMGTHKTIDYRRDNVADEVKHFTSGRGVDLICDHVAGPNFTDNIAMLSSWGTLVSIGATGGLPTEGLFKTMRANATNSPAVRCFSMHSYDSNRASRRKLMEEAIHLLASATIDPPIAATFALEEAAAAHRTLESGSALGRILLIP